MNNEPVARVNNEGFIVEIDEMLLKEGTLLYTHPHSEESVKVKELTDEEIEECYWGDGYPDNPRHPKEFAKAILRKAQEK